MNNEYICPKCGAIRCNASPVVETPTYKQVHLFCRQCETEFVVKEVKKQEKDERVNL